MNNTNIYKRTKTTISLLNYHFVFCPRYRRKIFLIPNLEDRFKQLVCEICKSMDIDILALECDTDHAHLFISAMPTPCPSKIIKEIKGITGRILRTEFAELQYMPNLWTRSYFVSTAGVVSSETIKNYVESQKKDSRGGGSNGYVHNRATDSSSTRAN